MRTGVKVIGVAALFALGACGAQPQTSPERGLYGDLRKAVEFHEGTDWVVDEQEVEEAGNVSMRAVCTATPDTRERLGWWLDQQIEARGGSSRALFEERGELNREIRELRRLERIKMLLDHTARIAESGCPYWLRTDEEFAGVESDAERWVIYGETAGSGALSFSGGDVAFGGGGGGRLMLGYGISSRSTLALGFEFGGAGTLPESDTGGRSFEAVFSAAVPLLFRVRNVTQVWDIEVAAVTRFTGGKMRTPGVRASIGFGFSTLRVTGFQPYALLWVGYEVLPADGASPAVHSLLLGTRVGIDWDP